VLPDNILRIVACQDLSSFPYLASPLPSVASPPPIPRSLLSLAVAVSDINMARCSLHQLLVSERDAGYFGTAERKCQEREITVEAGMGTDRKTRDNCRGG